MEQNSYIEEKTPKGYTIKIIVKKNSFLVFDTRGSTVYADPAGLKILHKIPAIAFLGKSFTVRNRRVNDFTFCKVSKGKIIVPFHVAGDKDMRYLLLETDENTDLIPVKIIFMPHVAVIAREAEAGNRPDLFVIDEAATESDIVVIRNRMPNSRIMRANEVVRAGVVAPKEIASDDARPSRATDILDDVNLNVLSSNPVFLSRVHLRQNDFSKVKQLLLDFDMVTADAGFILSFIDTMLKKCETDPALAAHRVRLMELHDDFAFYVALLEKSEKTVDEIIGKMTEQKTYLSYMTLIAKARSMCISQQDALLMTEFENKIMEKKEELKF
jgi:hypothetical protein